MTARLAPTLALLLCVPLLGAAPCLAAESAIDDDTSNTNAWPVLVNSAQPGGGHYLMVLGMFHRTTRADGATASEHIGPWLWSPAFSAVLPCWYRYGQGADTHHLLAPIYMDGPGWTACAPLLTARWHRAQGGTSFWATPFCHLDRRADGSLEDMHLLSYFKGDGYQVLLPFAYQCGRPGHEYGGVLPPVLLSGPTWWASLPLLSGGWTYADGSRSTWYSPLAHIDRDAEGTVTSWHALDFISWDDHWLLAPFAFGGQGNGCILPLLSGWWHDPDGSHSIMVTPLFHVTHGADHQISSLHCLTYIYGRNQSGAAHLVLPFYYHVTNYGATYQGLLPVYLAGPTWGIAPLFVSGHATHEDGSSTWLVTPAFHLSRSPDGTISSLHALTYVQWGQNHLLAPLAAWGRHWGVAPILGSWWWTSHDGSKHRWITPLAHADLAANGSVHRIQVLSAVWDHHGVACWPVFWDIHSKQGEHVGVMPFLASGPGYRLSPLVLGGLWQTGDGGHQLWVTPLLHVRREADGTLASWHVGPVIRTRNTLAIRAAALRAPQPVRLDRDRAIGGGDATGERAVAPLYLADRDRQHPWSVLVPIFVHWQRTWIAPLLLSASWFGTDGSHVLLVTPLVHRTTNAGGAVISAHYGPYISSGGFATVPPVYWSWQSGDGSRSSMYLPLCYHHQALDHSSTTLVLPPLVGYHQGGQLLDSLAWNCVPISAQRTTRGNEVSIAGEFIRMRSTHDRTTIWISPLWWSEHRPAAPPAWQALGGLLARNCDYNRRTSRWSILWCIPVGRRQPFSEPPSAPMNDHVSAVPQCLSSPMGSGHAGVGGRGGA